MYDPKVSTEGQGHGAKVKVTRVIKHDFGSFLTV